MSQRSFVTSAMEAEIVAAVPECIRAFKAETDPESHDGVLILQPNEVLCGYIFVGTHEVVLAENSVVTSCTFRDYGDMLTVNADPPGAKAWMTWCDLDRGMARA